MDTKKKIAVVMNFFDDLIEDKIFLYFQKKGFIPVSVLEKGYKKIIIFHEQNKTTQRQNKKKNKRTAGNKRNKGLQRISVGKDK